MILSLDHLQLAMPPGGEEQARAFYHGMLGMMEEEKPPELAARGGCWFRAGSAILHLGVEEPFTPQRKAHPAFCVSDLDQLAHNLAAQGVSVLWDHALPERRRLYVEDPFGNRLELMQDGDGFGQK
jgi:catechol 2,3-dioxygenase-like lactoylglutathione lyase family enzyme